MKPAEWILMLVMPPEEASAAVGDLIESNPARTFVWIGAARIAAATVVRQWTSTPLEIPKALGYFLLMLLRSYATLVGCLVLGSRILSWWILWSGTRGTFRVFPVFTGAALLVAELVCALSLRRRTSAEPGVKIFIRIARLSVVLLGVGMLVAPRSTIPFVSRYQHVIVLGVMLPIQLGRLLAHRFPSRALSSGVAAVLLLGGLGSTVSVSGNVYMAVWAVLNPVRFMLPLMLLVGVVSARRGMLREQRTLCQR